MTSSRAAPVGPVRDRERTLWRGLVIVQLVVLGLIVLSLLLVLIEGAAGGLFAQRAL